VETSLTDPARTIHDDQSAKRTETGQPARLSEMLQAAMPNLAPRRRLAVGIFTVTAVVGVAVLTTTSDNAAPADPVVLAERSDVATELDAHGIPTWWSGRAPAP
jgi:hypothetical protein